MATLTVAESYFRQAFAALGVKTRTHIIDLGSQQLKLINSRGQQVSIPSGFVWQKQHHHLVNFGAAAVEMKGKLPPAFELVWPIQNGRPVQQSTLLELFTPILNEQDQKLPLNYKILPSQICIVVSPTISQLETRMLRTIGQTLYATTQVIQSDEALRAQWQQLFPKQPSGMLMNSGAHKTELVIVSQGRLFRSKVIAQAGEQLTQAIRQAVRQGTGIQIGWATAEKLKKELVAVNQPDSRKKMVIRGQDIVSGFPDSKEVVAEQLVPPIQAALDQMISAIQHFLHELPPEIVSEAAEYPIYLTGGTSLLPGLPVYLTQKLHLEMIRAKEPLWDVVQGAQWLLKQ